MHGRVDQSAPRRHAALWARIRPTNSDSGVFVSATSDSGLFVSATGDSGVFVTTNRELSEC